MRGTESDAVREDFGMNHRLVFGLLAIIVCFAVCATPTAAMERWVDLSPASAGTPPTVDVREVVDGIAVDVDLAGFYAEERTSARGIFTVLEVPQFGSQGAVGEPELPFRTVLIPVANGPAASLTVIDADASIALSGVTIMPRQAPAPDCGKIESGFVVDDKAYAADRWFPAEVARIADDVVVRGQRFLVVEVRPLAFNPVREDVIVRPNLRLKIKLTGEVDVAAESLKAARRSALFPTEVDLDASSAPEAVPSGVEYLIISDDALESAFEPLADWKRKKGMTVEIVPMSAIGGTTHVAVKSYLQTRYDSDPDLTYVLLGGDYPTIPSESFSHPYSGTYVTDLGFSCLDGSDYFPDVVMSRIAVQNPSDCQNVISKILAWDRDVVPGAWHGDYLMAAYLQDSNDYNCDADRWFFETGTHAMHYIRDQVGMGVHTAATSSNFSCSPYDWRPDSYPHRFSGYSGQSVPSADADLITSASQSTVDIASAINGGVSIVQHRDHGGETGWGDPPFYNSNVAALANGDMTPIVYSINCLTGKFNYSSDSFAEALMNKYPGGAVGVMAATQVSYSGYNDLLAHGAYDGFWDDYDPADGGNVYPHSFRPAEAYLYGKYYMYNWEGASTYTELTFGLFHWHGDPEMRAYTAVPVAPSVTTDPTIPVGSSTLAVVVDVDGALVAVTDNGVLIGRAFASGGVAVVDLVPPPDTPTTLDVVVSGHNLVPWQGTVEVVVPVGPWMTHRGHLCDDSAGNGDGIANPGETIVLPVTVENIGADDGTGISGVLGSGSPHVTVVDSLATFPDAAAGAQVQSLPNHFSTTVNPAAPNGHVATLSLDWAASGGFSGSTLFSMPVCELLVISDVTVDFVGNASAMLAWTTNVPATSRLVYGDTVPPAQVIEDIGLTTSHVVGLTGLDACTDYFFEVASTSPGCYTTVDDNSGGFFGFTTTAGTVIVVDSSDTPLAIPDNAPAGVSSTVVASSPYDVVDVNVLVNITHTYTGDLDLYLIGPDGTSVELSTDNGGSGDNFTDTLFDDGAATSVTAGSAPFTGSFQPEQPLAALNGQPASGEWIFKVVDDAGSDLGTVDNWQLQLTVNEPCNLVGMIFSDGFEGGGTTAWSNVVP
jgi:subtilisin-like proprotein convertase family protein